MHPLDPAVGKGVADQGQFLVAHHRELLGDPNHRAVELADHPGSSLFGVGLALRHEALLPPQLDQALQALRQGTVADVAAVITGFRHRLLVQQQAERIGGHGPGEGVEQAQGEVFAAIRKPLVSGGGEAPAVAGTARTLRGGTGFHQAHLLESA